jgi:hypothetical protein
MGYAMLASYDAQLANGINLLTYLCSIDGEIIVCRLETKCVVKEVLCYPHGARD